MRIKVVYINTFVLACLSILYELLIAHTISTLAANTVVWYSLTIGIYMAFLGIGSIFYRKIFKGDTWEALFKVELALSIFGGVSVLTVHVGHMFFYYFMMNQATNFGIFCFFGFSFCISAVIGLLSGFELPLLIEAGNKESKGTRVTNRVLAFDYLGSLVGAFTFPLWLIPHYGTVQTGFMIAAVNLSAAIIIACTTFKRRKLLYITLCLPLVSLFALALSRVERVDQYFLRKYYYYYLSTNLKDIFSPNDTLPVVERIRSPYQKIDLVPSPVRAIPVLLMEAYSDKYEKEPNFPKYINLFIEGDFQVNSNMEEVYHEYFAHVPVILHQKIPKNILVLGAGDGLLNRELLKYPESRITQVELDPKMAAIAKTNPLLKRMNKGALEDPRVEILLEDAFQFLRRDRRLYDAVYIDFPNPVSYSLAKLYSKEFFQFLQRRLSPGGFVAINSAGIGYFKTVNDKGDQEIDSENTDWPIYYQTLRAAGFGTILPYISNFETQNDMVEPVLEKIGILQPASPHVRGDGKEEKLDKETRRSIITQVSQEQRSIMQHGFIFAKKETNPVQKKYIDFGITTHVLTEKRFYLAFAIPFPLPENRGKVNSIMKPAFPNLPFTYIRLPF